MSGVQGDDIFTDDGVLDLSGWSETPPTGVPETVEGDVEADVVVQRDPVLDPGDVPDPPVVDDLPEGTVELLWGIEREGERFRTAQVRELNGEDEEAISRLNEKAVNYTTLLTDTYLSRAVLSIGEVDVEQEPGALKELLIIDRDLLFKEIVLVTYGSTRDYENVPCPHCEQDLDIHVDVEGILEIRNNKPIKSDRTTVTLKNGDEVVIRYANGHDQIHAFSETKVMPTAPEINTRFIARCAETVNGEKIKGDKTAWAKALSYGDRAKIVAELLDVPELRFKGVEVPCERCGNNLPLVLGWADLLPA